MIKPTFILIGHFGIGSALTIWNELSSIQKMAESPDTV